MLDLEAAGFTVYGQDDLDRTHAPWLVAKNDDVQHWAFLVSAKASGVSDAPMSVAELEARARRAEEESDRQTAERKRWLEAARRQAQPVTSGRVEGVPRPTPAAAAATVEAHGGRIELRKDGELQIALPIDVGAGTAPVEAAKSSTSPATKSSPA